MLVIEIIARGSGLSFRLVQLEYPCQEVGLPEGYENLDILPSRDLLRKFYKALSMFQQPLEKHLEKEIPPPTCIISDKCLSCILQVCNVSRLIYILKKTTLFSPVLHNINRGGERKRIMHVLYALVVIRSALAML